MSEIRVNKIKDTGGVERFLAKAWANFNGTGAIAIRASGNISSLTDNGVGDYTLSFMDYMPDVNFCTVIGVKQKEDNTSGGTLIGTLANYTSVTTSVRILIFESTIGGANDALICNVAVFR